MQKVARSILGHRRRDSARAMDQGLSLTVDHRIVDGAPSGAFLSDLAERIETIKPA